MLAITFAPDGPISLPPGCLYHIVNRDDYCIVAGHVNHDHGMSFIQNRNLDYTSPQTAKIRNLRILSSVKFYYIFCLRLAYNFKWSSSSYINHLCLLLIPHSSNNGCSPDACPQHTLASLPLPTKCHSIKLHCYQIIKLFFLCSEYKYSFLTWTGMEKNGNEWICMYLYTYAMNIFQGQR